jgi:hypothetical protein
MWLLLYKSQATTNIRIYEFFLDKQIKHKNVINYIIAQTLSWFGHVKDARYQNS